MGMNLSNSLISNGLDTGSHFFGHLQLPRFVWVTDVFPPKDPTVGVASHPMNLSRFCLDSKGEEDQCIAITDS